MTTTIDAAGRLVIPGPVRREAALEPGVPLEVRWRDGIIEIEPQPMPVALEKRGRLLVARPKVKVRPLGTAAVERTRREISTGRGRRTLPYWRNLPVRASVVVARTTGSSRRAPAHRP